MAMIDNDSIDGDDEEDEEDEKDQEDKEDGLDEQDNEDTKMKEHIEDEKTTTLRTSGWSSTKVLCCFRVD